MSDVKKIYYRAGYKYQLAVTHTHVLQKGCRRLGVDYEDDFLALAGNVLTIRSGYAWNGASGPTWDSKSSMRGSLIHDALFQLIQLGVLPQNQISLANDELYVICRQDHMNPLRAQIWHMGVDTFGDRYAELGTGQPLLSAP